MTITQLTPIIFGAVAAFASVNWIYFKILQIAISKKLVDNPDARKLQKRPIPLVGGLAVFFGVLFGLMVASMCHHILIPEILHTRLFPILCAMGIMLYVGALDDILGLSPKSRFIIEIAVVLIIIFDTGMCVDTFHGMWGVNAFSWWFAVPLTVIAGVGIINAINMIDGVNGLSSGICIVSSILFGTIFIIAQDIPNAVLAFTMAAALLPFYIHNVFGLKSRMFIGDAGTMVMGMLMTWFLICMLSSKSLVSYYHTENGVNMIAMSLAVLSVPVFDTLRVMTMRIMKKKNPFKPDKTHLHHVFVNVGVSHFITSTIEILLGLLIFGIWLISVCCGVGLDVQLYIVIAASMICVWGTYAFMRYQISHQTELLHHMTGYSIRTHLGRTQWWKNITSWLDKPGDYSELEMDATTNISQCVEDHIKGINSEINYKEYDRKLILEYLKGKAEVHVDDIIANSGADKLRVYPILFEEVMDGFIVVVKENKYGSPVIVSLKGEKNI